MATFVQTNIPKIVFIMFLYKSCSCNLAHCYLNSYYRLTKIWLNKLMSQEENALTKHQLCYFRRRMVMWLRDGNFECVLDVRTLSGSWITSTLTSKFQKTGLGCLGWWEKTSFLFILACTGIEYKVRRLFQVIHFIFAMTWIKTDWLLHDGKYFFRSHKLPFSEMFS